MPDDSWDRPVWYEWRRPDGEALRCIVAAEYMPVGFWPWDLRVETEPAGPVQMWRTVGEDSVMVADTPGGPVNMVIYRDGEAYPFKAPGT